MKATRPTPAWASWVTHLCRVQLPQAWQHTPPPYHSPGLTRRAFGRLSKTSRTVHAPLALRAAAGEVLAAAVLNYVETHFKERFSLLPDEAPPARHRQSSTRFFSPQRLKLIQIILTSVCNPSSFQAVRKEPLMEGVRARGERGGTTTV